LYSADSADNPVLGDILLVAGQFSLSAVSAIEEKLFGDMEIHPLQAMGIEGTFGMCYSGLAILVLNFIPCNSSMCSDGYVENIPFAI
jgi:hypothetical protein